MKWKGSAMDGRGTRFLTLPHINSKVRPGTANRSARNAAKRYGQRREVGRSMRHGGVDAIAAIPWGNPRSGLPSRSYEYSMAVTGCYFRTAQCRLSAIC